MGDVKGRTVLFVVPAARWKDEEYTKPYGILERKGLKIVVTTSVDRPSFGLNQTRARPELLLDAVDVSKYDAVYFVGGMGVKDYYENAHALRIAREAAEQGKVVAAIDLAPTLLGKAGLLNGKKVTEYFSESKTIQAMGAQYTAANVQVDGNIITAKSAESAESIAFAIIKGLEALPAPS